MNYQYVRRERPLSPEAGFRKWKARVDDCQAQLACAVAELAEALKREAPTTEEWLERVPEGHPDYGKGTAVDQFAGFTQDTPVPEWHMDTPVFRILTPHGEFPKQAGEVMRVITELPKD